MSKLNLYTKGIHKFKKGDKGLLTKNFDISEFHCKCKRPECRITLIDLDHVDILQTVRDIIGLPFKISSAYRCGVHNKIEGGKLDSQHPKGTATDIQIRGKTPSDWKEIALEHFDGVGIYPTFIHVDSRGVTARWWGK
ncbi:MAG: YcbK family protein [Steroidobacteraceae bacterium]